MKRQVVQQKQKTLQSFLELKKENTTTINREEDKHRKQSRQEHQQNNEDRFNKQPQNQHIKIDKHHKQQHHQLQHQKKDEYNKQHHRQHQYKQKQQEPHRTDTLNSNLTIKVPDPMHNVDFYLGKRKSFPQGDYIDIIHKTWKGNYNLLEKHHGFIQWLFPNAFKSRFNSDSHPLSNEEEKQFRVNPQIYNRYLKSYDIMLQFYGMKLKNRQTGQITTTRNPDYKQRFYLTFITSWHNHMRITRMLSSLTMIGFGRYAKQLAKFLNKQISRGELKRLEKYGINKDWIEYQSYHETQEDLNEFFKKKKHKEQ